MAKESPPGHPGAYVRANILNPRKVTVTEAAKLIGISRPGVSNFLNGKVSATPDMAARLERAFGVSAKTILDLQTAYDAEAGKAAGTAQKARAYVTPFLNVAGQRSRQLVHDDDHWRAPNSLFCCELSFTRRATVSRRSTFPATMTQNAQAGMASSRRIPAHRGFRQAPPDGSSVSRQTSRAKADGDFAKSVKATKKADRANITFVFVTPRRWPGKTAWTAEMKAKKLWKDVRAYDASDLEQWMEQSLAAQTWFANQTDRPSSGVRTLERCWDDWANVAEPALHPALFSTAVQVWGDKVKAFVAKDRSEPLVIAADSVEEALAFLSQVLSGPELEHDKDRVLVFDEPGVLPKLAQGSIGFIAVAHTREVEREFGPYGSHVANRCGLSAQRNQL